MSCNLNEVLDRFDISMSAQSYGNGHINDTYLVESNPKYILQKINSNVFKNPPQVMDNIEKVTNHLRKKIADEGGDPDRETMLVINTKDGKNFYKTCDGEYFRMYRFVDDATSYDNAENAEMFYEAARAFGKFQKLLSDFPMEELHETIPKFHDTRNRFLNLKKAIENDVCGRAADIAADLELALSFENEVGVIVDGIADGSLPLRVTHNDTKLNNVLIDDKTGKGLCVIDLDTVMPGSLLYDFGDALRIGASNAAEDEADLSKVTFNLEYFESFAKGFLEEVGTITDRERELLPFSAMLITYECGIRFLTDYLEGDTYFKIHREGHNLDRARNQIKLACDIRSKFPQMKEIIDRIG